jgi:2,4-dienoyl-CoA reductase-like NADH-dependent reductase (Old Yellow Enzyme family)
MSHNEGFEKAYSPFHLRHLRLRNRFLKTATYEGMYDDGLPSERLISHHSAVAAGGVAMTTVAYGAVNAHGRTHEKQMYMHEAVVPGLTALTESVHTQGGAASLQLTHCGFFSKDKTLKSSELLAPSRLLNLYGFFNGLIFSHAMTAGDIRHMTDEFAAAAALAVRCGFDAVEIHMGHGYLLSQFLSPRINRRRDSYGGTLSNRLRFPLEVLTAVREAVGEKAVVLCKINMSDDFRGGLTVEDAIEVARNLEKAGADALVLSGGYTSRTPFFLMRGDVPLKEMIAAEPDIPYKLALALFGSFIIKKYPFTKNYFLSLARQIRQAVTMPLVYVGGAVSSEGIRHIMDEGFDLVALGRALIHDPDFIQKMKEGPTYVSPCNHCNICVAEMDRGGVRCVLNI